MTDINEADRTGICSICGPVKIKIRDGKKKTLNAKWRCYTKWKQSYNKSLYPYAVHKKDHCENCGFDPVHSSQLDVDHIDGDRWNNDPVNLQTLCANCHRLKTHVSGDSNSGKF